MEDDVFSWRLLQLRGLLLVIATLQFLRERGRKRRIQRRPRQLWSRAWLLRRPDYGIYEKLVVELKGDHIKDFTNFMRVGPELWHELLNRVGPVIERKNTFMRKCLDPGTRLALTLRYLASGDSYKSIMYGFRVASNTVSVIVSETCQAIIDVFMQEVINCPRTEQEWLDVAKDFSLLWNFEHCIGAMDGKHVAIRCPPNGGSTFYNYKGFHSIVLLALVDARYRFLYIDVGANGACSDSGIFKELDIFRAFDRQYIGVPDESPLPNDDQDIPYFLVADDAFAMRTWLMKPYSRRLITDPERIFNYRLSRARRVVENTFGILVQRFRCLLTTMQQLPETAETIVMACCVLHNLILDRQPNQGRQNVDREDAHHNMIPGNWRDEDTLLGLRSLPGNTTIKKAKLQRDYLREYYNSDAGSVPWQNNMI